ncbi:MAG TPA: CPBP family glutamic-type intramembrane protease [Mucilaginibacter sp.]|jgi:membrane protease YdiL (CAAX protease family)|nr:CPBP family glutamic-type intramembrane protease [Mucilaginibacter sp.]
MDEFTPIASKEEVEDAIDSTGPRCSSCDAPLREEDRFCRKCGLVAGPLDDAGAAEKKWNAVRQLILFFIIEAIICATSFVKALDTFSWMVCGDVLLALVAIVFVALNWKACKPLLTWNDFSWGRLLLYCTLAIVASIIISFVVDWLNLSLFSKRVSYHAYFSRYNYAIALTIFFTALTPSLFEELAFRVFLLGKLLMVTEKRPAIFISAFMFGIMHMSFLSLFWLIPFGLALAWLRIRHRTMWYGSCIHFCFNFTVCITEIWQAARHY